MTWVAVGVGGAAIGGSVISGLFGSNAAKQNSKLMQQALAYQQQKDAQTRGDLAPYRQFGGEQLNSLNSWLADPTNSPSSHLDPGYQFRLEQGNKGITGNAGTAGLLQSGDTLKGLTNYGQESASQEYNNAFNRYLAEGQFKQGLAGMGQNAATGSGYLANQGAANVSNTSANTNAGGADQVWANVASGLGGGVGNALARRMAPNQPIPQVPGGANIFGGKGGGGTMQYATTPYYNG